MSQVSLQDLLRDIQTNNAETFNNAKEGKNPSSAWDGAADLPLTLEYRLRVDNATYGPSKSTGNPQITITYEVVEPVEYAGKKFQEYVNPKPNNEVGSRKLAELLGALQASFDFGEDWEAFAQQFIDKTVTATLRLWGQENDRVGTRYVNLDRGQTLRTGLTPPKAKGASNADLRPDIQIPKVEEPVKTADIPTPAPVSPPLPGGVNLPPGLAS